MKRCKQLGMTAKDIGFVLEKNPEAIRQRFLRLREVEGLPPKVKLSKSSVSGRAGLLFKRILLNNSKLGLKMARAYLIQEFQDLEHVPSVSSFSRYLRASGWKNVKSVWQPPTSARIRANRLAYVDRWLVGGRSTIGDVIWSDETTVKSQPNTRREKHWTPPTTPRPTQARVHSGGISQMFWGCVSKYGRGPLITIDGTMDQKLYLEVLRDQLLPELEYAQANIPGEWKFMQDNCPAHRSQNVRAFLQENNVECIEWPAYSPDLNPIENVWAWMKRKLAAENPPCETNEQLVDAFLRIWEQLTPELCARFCDGYEKRLKAVKKAKGYGTKY